MNEHGRYRERKLGTADDIRDANGLDVLSFSEAQAAARKWFDELAHQQQGRASGPYLLRQACDDYLADYQQRGGKDEANTKARLERIKLELGSSEVARLTAVQIKTWYRGIAQNGRLVRRKSGDQKQTAVRAELNLANRDAKRRRLATANRELTVLKAVLNFAFKNQEEIGITIPSRKAWESVASARGVDAPKVRHLTDKESVRLLNTCQPDFRDLVAAALLTGCRYGELCRLCVRDFDPRVATIHVELSKSGKPRTVALTDEGVAHFRRLARGKNGDDLLLLQTDGSPWVPSLQIRRMMDACQRAKISPAVSFHILRHTYGSRLAMKGAPMAVIAAQLGHADTRMTERHYAHLAPSYVANVVRELLGSIGVPQPTDNLVPIEQALAR